MKDLFALLLQVSSVASKCGAELEDCVEHWKPVLTLAAKVSGQSISQWISKMMIDSLTNMIELECDGGYSSLWEHCSNYARSHKAGLLDHLDDNCLSHVFTFFPERDIKTMELVCHRTLQISRSMYKPFKNKSVDWEQMKEKGPKGRLLRQLRRSQVTSFDIGAWDRRMFNRRMFNRRALNRRTSRSGCIDLNDVLPSIRNDVRSVKFNGPDNSLPTVRTFDFKFPNVTEVSIQDCSTIRCYDLVCQVYHECTSFLARLDYRNQNPELISGIITALQRMSKLNKVILRNIHSVPIIGTVERMPKITQITHFEVGCRPNCLAGFLPFFHDRLETLDISFYESPNVNATKQIPIPNLRNLVLEASDHTGGSVYPFIVSQFQLPDHLETIDLCFCALPTMVPWMTHEVDELFAETEDETMFGQLNSDMMHQMIDDAMIDCKVKNFKLKFALGLSEDFMTESNRVVLIMRSMVMNSKHSSFTFDLECSDNFYQQNVGNFTHLESFDSCTLNIKIY